MSERLRANHIKLLYQVRSKLLLYFNGLLLAQKPVIQICCGLENLVDVIKLLRSTVLDTVACPVAYELEDDQSLRSLKLLRARQQQLKVPPKLSSVEDFKLVFS